MVDGTVPLFYKMTKYNLPIKVWLPPRYPVDPPIAYVEPTTDMVINAKCEHVDPNGRISSPYLQHWNYPAGNIFDFVSDLQILFQERPPLYAKKKDQPAPAPAPAQVHRPQPPPTAQVHAVNPLAAGASGLGGGRPQPTPQTIWSGVMQSHTPAPSPPTGTSLWQGVMQNGAQQQQQQQQAAQLAQQQQQQAAQLAQQQEQQRKQQAQQQRDAAYRVALTTALAARLGSALDASARADYERQRTIKAELESRATVLRDQVAQLQRERQGLDGASHELAGASSALDRWLAENEPRAQALRASANGEIDPDEAIVAADTTSQHALLAQSVDLATEDAMAALDRALEQNSRGKIPLDVYLRQINALSLKQFTARALSSRIAAKQASERQAARPMLVPQTAVAGPSSTGAQAAPAPPAQLPIGDSFHATGGILMNPLAAAVKNMRIS